MTTTYNDLIIAANTLLSNKDYDNAIDSYTEALDQTTAIEQKIDIYNTLGRIYLLQNKVNAAVDSFKKSLDIHNSLSTEKQETLKANKATILNNIGIILVKYAPKEAMKYHKEALLIFLEEFAANEKEFIYHLANTHYSYGDAAFAKGDFFMAKKQYKDAIAIYTKIGEKEMTLPLIANAHYNLGNVYTDENNVYDARNNYLKALKIFRKLTETNPASYRSLVAATFNNLAVTAKTMYKYADAITYYEKSEKEYERLVEQDRETFLPFYAATLSSIGIIYSEQHEVKDDYDSFGLSGFSGFGTLSTDNSLDQKESKKDLKKFRKDKAESYYKRALNLYSQLVEKEPENYEHYLATCYHNLGVLYDTNSEFKKAEEFFEKALLIRRKLAKVQPEHFNLDVCVTLLNVVTMYQNLLEQTVNIGFKDASLKILDEIKTRLVTYKDDKRPIIEGMRGDTQYFIDYFNAVNEEQLDVFDAIVKEMAVIEKINETAVPLNKMKMQQMVVELYENLTKSIKNNARLNDVLLAAYIKYAWFALRSKELKIANDAINNGLKINPNSLDLKVNLGHLQLLQEEKDKALSIYNDVKTLENEENKSYLKIIKEDLEVLVRDAVITNELRESIVSNID